MVDRVEIVVDDKLRILLDELSEEIQKELRELFTHNNPLYYKAKQMGFWTKESRDIKTWKNEKDSDGNWWMTLPRGGMQRLRDVFDKYSIDWYATDNRSRGYDLGSYTGDWVKGDIFLKHNLVLWSHQPKIAEAIEKYENCLVRAPTGSGKSAAAIYTITLIQLPTLVIVWSSSLLDQWVERVSNELGIHRNDIGIIQGKKCNLKPITLAMQQTLNRYTPKQWDLIKDSFGFIICDEVQRYAADTFVKTITNFTSQYRVGISADERRKDKKEFLIYDMFGKVVEDISDKELIKKKLILDVEIRVVPTEFKADWYIEQIASGDKTKEFNRLIEEMTTDTNRNELIRQLIARLAKQQYRMLVFSQRVEHCKRLDTLTTASGYKSGLLIGGNDYTSIFESTKQGLMDGTRQVGIGTLSGGSSVGLDIPQVGHGILTTPIHNNRQFMKQVSGRLCRISEGKSKAQLYVIWDQYVFGKKPLLNFRRWYSTVKVQVGNRWQNVNEFLKGYVDYAETKRYQEDEAFASANTVRR